MKKIMFNDHFALTDSVLCKSKKRTTRIAPQPKNKEWDTFQIKGTNKYGYGMEEKPGIFTALQPIFGPKYQVGEIVAIAQSYKQIFEEMMLEIFDYDLYEAYRDCAMGQKLAGNTNKMFVRSELMPHQIKITKVSFKPLLAITDDECLKEGINPGFGSPKLSFYELINAICGKNTYTNNPWTFGYEFKLLK
jgi:hypothetical protein